MWKRKRANGIGHDEIWPAFLIFSNIYVRVYGRMRKKSQRLQSYGPCVTLFRTDLEEILTIFRENCHRVKVADDDYEYDNLNDIKKVHGSEISKLDITGFDPFVTFEKSNRLYLGADEGGSVPYFKIRSILDRRKRSVLIFVLKPVVLVLFCLVYIGAVLFGFTLRHPNSSWNGLFYTGAIGLVIFAAFVWMNGHFGTILQTPNSKPS